MIQDGAGMTGGRGRRPDRSGVGVVGGGEGVLAVLIDRAGRPEVHRCRGVPGDPGMTMNVVVLVEESGQNCRASASEAKDAGNSGRYLRVLNCASPNGLSLDTCGRLWDWVTPRSASRNVTGLEVSRCYEE